MVFDHLRAVGPELAAALPKDGTPWYRKSHLRRLNFSSLSLALLASANGFDGSLMNGLQALPQWNSFMDEPTGAWLGFINAIQSLGAFVTYPLVAWCANKLGRKKTVLLAYIWLAVGTALQSGAQNPAMFIVGRFFIGGVTSFFGISSPVLITETAFPTHRSIVTAMYNSGWYVGSGIAAWATYGTRNYANDTASWAWRIPSILQLLIPIVALPGILLCPESPRWLVDVGRIDEARAVLVKFHAGGDSDSELVAFEMAEIAGTLHIENALQKTTTWADLYSTKGNRRRLFISLSLGVFAQWNGVGIVSYYLAPALDTIGVTSVTEKTLISGFLQIWNLILAVGAALCVDRLGRRTLFLTSCSGMLVSYIIISGLSGSFAGSGKAAIGTAVIPFLFIYYGFYDIAFTPLLISYTCEIWPYQLRARGLSAMNLATQSAIFFNIFVNPIALEKIGWKYYIFYACLILVITIVIYLTYPETCGHTLEQMARIFDGPDAVVTEPADSKESVKADNVHLEQP